jgi:NADPH:quinone reductase-like Zn-dependent oxidoreductase
MSFHAWVLQTNETAFDLTLQTRPDIDPASIPPSHVLIRVHAASLNYRDIVGWKNLAGRKMDGRVPVSDGAGEVIACGSAVKDYHVGDRVAGCFFQAWQSGPFEMLHHQFDLGGTLDGMLQQTVCLPHSGIVAVPRNMSYEQAATLPCAALTAWTSLVRRGQLVQGQSVLCIGTGGVSIFALQIAKAMGASVVILSSSDTKLQRAVALGADHAVNYRDQPNWSKDVLEWTQGRGVDHVVEVGGPGTLEQSMRSVRASGHIALIGVLTGFGPTTASLFPLLAKNVQLNGIYVGPRIEFEAMNQFLEAHAIAPVVDRVFEMSQAEQAFEYLASGSHFGKVVIRVPS